MEMGDRMELTQDGMEVRMRREGGFPGFSFGDKASGKAEDAAPLETVPTSLDASAWPIVHGSRASLDSTPLLQPVGQGSKLVTFSTQSVDSGAFHMAQMLMSNMMGAGLSGNAGLGFREFAKQAATLMSFDLANANPVSIVTEKVSDTEQLLWTSTIANVVCYKRTMGSPELELVAKLDHGYNFRFHGAYAFVGSANGRNAFFTTVDDSLVRYELRDDNNGRSKQILETGRVSLPAHLNADKSDHLVGVTVLEDGTIVVGSKHGTLMAVRVTSADGALVRTDVLSVADYAKTPNSEVSNSISSLRQAVYVVTQREQVRVDYNPSTSKFAFRWSTVYGPEEQWYIGRLGPGSGATPTVTQCGGKDLVVITDGALPMNVIWYDAETGEVAGKRKVQFAQDENGNLPTTSEQSVAVDGCKAFVVQNYMGSDTLEDDVQCMVAPDGGEVRNRLPTLCARVKSGDASDLFVTKTCPPAFGCASFGAALYEINPSKKGADGQLEVTRRWTRPDVSCGTSIPLISTNKSSNAAYCIGVKKGSSSWAMLGMDMSTGAEMLNYQFFQDDQARNFFANPFYAGVEAVGTNELVIGSVGGVLFVSPDARSPLRQLSDSMQDMFHDIRSTRHPTWKMVGIFSSAGIALLAVILFVFRKGIKALSPRLPN